MKSSFLATSILYSRYPGVRRFHGRKQRARQAAAVATTFERAEAFAAALTRDLDRCAALERESMAILEELSALTHSPASHVLGPG